MIRAFEQASEKPIPYQIVERRLGDVAECWADPSKAETELGWKSQRGLLEMMADTWRWQSLNPQGYDVV
ncbi:UDP-glucose 4-epimerase [compost metagenome]